MIYFLFQKISIGRWSEKEMLVLLGNFYILSYSIFFLFWRGFLYLVRNIRNGTFDYNLIRPADSQFLVSAIGGGVHNLLALLFGIGVVAYGLIQLQAPVSGIQIIAWIISILVAILACYSYIFLLITLNFRFGYLEEVVNLAFTFQDFSRYPIDAFSKLPFYLLFFAIPFSALTTVPSMILTDTIFPVGIFLIFMVISISFIFFVRRVWFSALKSYTSSS